MDDLKTYPKNDDEQRGLLRTMKYFSDNIGMEFRLNKCANTTFKRGRLDNSSNIDLDVNTIIQDLNQEGTYKYLGVSEGDGVQHSQMKEKIQKEYYCRIRMVLKSELNYANKLEAINTLAEPLVTYSFNTINWKLQELAKLDTKTMKFLTMYKMHHPNLTWTGCTCLELKAVEGSHNWSFNLSHPLSVLINTSRRRRTPSSTLSKTMTTGNPCTPSTEDEVNTTYACRTKAKAKHQGRQQLRSKGESKALHGKYPQQVK